METADQTSGRCSFCGNSDVKLLLAARDAAICADCAERAIWLVRERGRLGAFYSAFRHWVELLRDEPFGFFQAVVPALALGWAALVGMRAITSGAERMPFSAWHYVGVSVVLAMAFLTLDGLLASRPGLSNLAFGTAWAASGFALGLGFGWIGAAMGAVGAVMFWGAAGWAHRRGASTVAR